jgi:hypothetical protein
MSGAFANNSKLTVLGKDIFWIDGTSAQSINLNTCFMDTNITTFGDDDTNG